MTCTFCLITSECCHSLVFFFWPAVGVVLAGLRSTPRDLAGLCGILLDLAVLRMSLPDSAGSRSMLRAASLRSSVDVLLI